jgi:hypothetical protein
MACPFPLEEAGALPGVLITDKSHELSCDTSIVRPRIPQRQFFICYCDRNNKPYAKSTSHEKSNRVTSRHGNDSRTSRYLEVSTLPSHFSQRRQAYFRGQPRFANEIPRASAALRSSPAFFRTSTFSCPLGMLCAASKASSLRPLSRGWVSHRLFAV